jgi:hypothetical protein
VETNLHCDRTLEYQTSFTGNQKVKKQTNKQEDILQLGSLWRLAQNPAGYNEMAAI